MEHIFEKIMHQVGTYTDELQNLQNVPDLCDRQATQVRTNGGCAF